MCTAVGEADDDTDDDADDDADGMDEKDGGVGLSAVDDAAAS